MVVFSITVSEMDDEKKNNASQGNGLTIATIGSKNRVCLPPNTCSHLGTQQGDSLVFVHKFTKKDKTPYVLMKGIKPENFEVEEETAETAVDVIKRS